MITNGTLLDAGLLALLSQVRLSYVIVSLNAATRDTFLSITGRDMFDRVVENLRTWARFGREHPVGSFRVYSSFVVMRSNFRELPQFIRLAQDLGTEIQLLHVIGDRGGEDIFVRQDQHKALHNILAEADEVAIGTTREQVTRIRRILSAHRIEAGAAMTAGFR